MNKGHEGGFDQQDLGQPNKGQYQMTSDQIGGMNKFLQVGTEMINLCLRGNEETVAITYSITLGGVNIGGVLYLCDAIENSYSDGAFVGAVIGAFHIDGNDPEAHADNGLIKVSVKIDVENHKLYGRYYTRTIHGRWDIGDWIEIVSWQTKS